MYPINWFDVLIFARVLFAIELIALKKLNKVLHEKIISRMMVKKVM